MQILVSDAILADLAQWPDLESLLDRARHNPDAMSIRSIRRLPGWRTHGSPKLIGVGSRIGSNATTWAAKDAALCIGSERWLRMWPSITAAEALP